MIPTYEQVRQQVEDLMYSRPQRMMRIEDLAQDMGVSVLTAGKRLSKAMASLTSRLDATQRAAIEADGDRLLFLAARETYIDGLTDALYAELTGEDLDALYEEDGP